MKNRTKITAIITATLLALSTTACRPASAPSPEPTTTGGTDRITVFYSTLDTLADVVSQLGGDSTIIMTGQVANSNIQTIKDIIYNRNQQYNINLNMENVTGLTSIPNNGFYNCDTLQSIILPNTVNSIGTYGFQDCNNLQKIIIPNSVKTIGSNAFYHCDSLTTINIPASVTSIGSDAFWFCNSLIKISVDPNNLNYSSDENGVLFNKNKTTLIKYPTEREGDYTIPNSVTTISVRAFHQCRKLTSITIPDSVKSIGEYAFYSCSGITTLVIPNSIKTINRHTFASCSGLTSLTLSESLLTINTSAFFNCQNLQELFIPASVTSIDPSAFESCYSLTGISVDSNNQYYSNDENGILFNKNKTTLVICPCTKAGSYTIPDTVTTIGNHAFCTCKNLTNIIITNKVTTIGNLAFASCSNLTSITIPASVIKIEPNTFFDCTNLTSITFTDSNNWNKTTSTNYSDGSPEDVTNPETNATNFKGSLRNYYWYKN